MADAHELTPSFGFEAFKYELQALDLLAELPYFEPEFLGCWLPSSFESELCTLPPLPNLWWEFQPDPSPTRNLYFLDMPPEEYLNAVAHIPNFLPPQWSGWYYA